MADGDLPRFGERGGGSAHCEKLFGQDAETCGAYRWLRDIASRGIPVLGPVVQQLQMVHVFA